MYFAYNEPNFYRAPSSFSTYDGIDNGTEVGVTFAPCESFHVNCIDEILLRPHC